jgi:type II secretory pathway component PulF
LVRSIEIFNTLFQGLGVQLPGATRFLLVTYVWLFPFLFVGAAILVIAKELVMRDVRGRLAATLVIFVAAASSVGLVVFVLYLPVLELLRKLVSK